MTQCPRCGFETENTIPDAKGKEEGYLCNDCVIELTGEGKS
ncbi:transposase-like protein [Paenibacillus sp. PastH-3]|nr:transposase-like protein [Paenibacillus sp. PastH-4]MDH6443275.1 transposase-like protein [Paenibacillus sp. PastF-4]MDH6526021.1 transposase-like protein [Paenibacillus sp. PastH-3]